MQFILMYNLFQLVFMVIIRMFFMEKVFTKQELLALDDPLPSFHSVISPKGQFAKGIFDRKSK